MIKSGWIILFCCLATSAFSQSDTIVYYDPYWNETTEDKAEYFRKIKEENGFFKVRDHYITGEIQMKGQYSSLYPQIEEGYFLWYYDNGQKLMEGNYIHGKREGLWTFWFPDGLKKQTVKYIPKREEHFKIKWKSERIKASKKYFDKGLLKKRRKEYQKALAHFDTALEINPYFAEALYEKGVIHVILNEKEKGCHELQIAKRYGFYDNELINRTMEELCD